MCLEVDLLAVAEAEVDRGAAAGGLGPERVELAPGAEDLVEVVLLAVVSDRRRASRLRFR